MTTLIEPHIINLSITNPVEVVIDVDEDGITKELNLSDENELKQDLKQYMADYFELPITSDDRLLFLDEYIDVTILNHTHFSTEDSKPISFNPVNNTITEQIDTTYEEKININIILNKAFPLSSEDKDLLIDSLQDQLSLSSPSQLELSIIPSSIGAPFLGKKDKVQHKVAMVLTVYENQLEPWQMSYKISQKLSKMGFKIPSTFIDHLAININENKPIKELTEDAMLFIEDIFDQQSLEQVKDNMSRETVLSQERKLGLGQDHQELNYKKNTR